MELTEILTKAEDGRKLSREEIVFLLNRKEKEEIEEVFAAARRVRQKNFGNKVYLYGFVYFSTYCKNNCTFCFYRAENQIPPRYRKTKEEIVNTAVELKESGIHLIDLTMGEDPYFAKNPQELLEIIREVKQKTGLPVMLSPGVLSNEMIDQVKDAGADWYALYQETHTREHYQRLRLRQDYDVRMQAKQYAQEKGMLIEEGLLTGIGETKEEIAKSFEVMEQIHAKQVRTMTFIPQTGTPLETQRQDTFLTELLNIAIMRLLFPKCLIPASLDVDGAAGLKERLQAGANVVTSIIPPNEGYLGVANAETDVDQGYRTVQGIQPILRECGLKNATAEEYKQWIKEQTA